MSESEAVYCCGKGKDMSGAETTMYHFPYINVSVEQEDNALHEWRMNTQPVDAHANCPQNQQIHRRYNLHRRRDLLGKRVRCIILAFHTFQPSMGHTSKGQPSNRSGILSHSDQQVGYMSLPNSPGIESTITKSALPDRQPFDIAVFLSTSML